MIIRQGLNFAVHFAGGILVGALAVAALSALRRNGEPDTLSPYEPEPAMPPQPQPSGGPPAADTPDMTG